MRQNHRFAQTNHLQCVITLENAESQPIVLKNLSQGGLCVSLNAEFPAQRHLEVALQSNGKQIKLRAQTVWSEKIGLTTWQHGLKFVPDSEPAVEYLQILNEIGEREVIENFLLKDFIVADEHSTLEELENQIYQRHRPVVVVNSNQQPTGILDYKNLLDLIMSELPGSSSISRYMSKITEPRPDSSCLKTSLLGAIGNSLSLVPFYNQNRLIGLINVGPAAIIVYEMAEIERRIELRRRSDLQEKISATVETNNASIVKLSLELREFMNLLENTAGMGLPEKILELTSQTNAILSIRSPT